MSESDPEVDVTTTGALVASTDDILSAQHDDLSCAVDSITENGMKADHAGMAMVTPQEVLDSQHIEPASEHNNSQVQMVSSSDGLSVLETAGMSNLALLGNSAALTNAQHLYLTDPNSMGENLSVPTCMAENALQSLLTGAGGNHLALANGGETIQIITVANTDLAQAAGKILQFVPATMNRADLGATIISINQNGEQHEMSGLSAEQQGLENAVAAADSTSNAPAQVVDMVPVCSVPDSLSSILMPPPQQPVQQLPPGTPSWAARLRDCEKIGDAYRGWVESEVELDLLLTFHKQQTQSLWGTRQSPSPAKQSTRLMWKSQYVPFDGVPFVNTGSRAIVMECQYGPRRKGAQVKKTCDHRALQDFKQTCPARIYIKKVRKFHEFLVDLNMDKKSIKCAMEKAFQLLKERGVEGYGQERFYVQLPTEKAHEFHGDIMEEVHVEQPHRLHPRVAERIRDLVAGGETRLYAIRKNLRHFVEHDLFGHTDGPPEKHNLTYYPTVNDLQNHIQSAILDIENGSLPVTAPLMDLMGNTSDDADDQWNTSGDSPHAETVTVTLTQNPGEDGHHVISKVETHLSDGSTRVSSHLTLETAQLLSKLHPNMFPAGSIVQVGNDDSSCSTSTIQKVTLTTEDGTPLDVLEQEGTGMGRGSEALTTLQVVQREATELVEAVQMGAVLIEPEGMQNKTADSSGDFLTSNEDALQMGDGTHLALAEDFIASTDNGDGNITIVTAQNGQYMFQYAQKEDCHMEEDPLIKEEALDEEDMETQVNCLNEDGHEVS